MATIPTGPLRHALANMPTARDEAERNTRTIATMVGAFARQDIDTIIGLFAEDAIYCDILGRGPRGEEFFGKVAIRAAFLRQWTLIGHHTYVDPTILADSRKAFASWTLVLGDPANPHALRFEGIDHFVFDGDGKLALKKAWLKGHPRLRRALPRHPRYMMAAAVLGTGPCKRSNTKRTAFRVVRQWM
jgi:hypothetical protein